MTNPTPSPDLDALRENLIDNYRNAFTDHLTPITPAMFSQRLAEFEARVRAEAGDVRSRITNARLEARVRALQAQLAALKQAHEPTIPVRDGRADSRRLPGP